MCYGSHSICTEHRIFANNLRIDTNRYSSHTHGIRGQSSQLPDCRRCTRDRGFDTNGVTGEKGSYVQPSRITLAHAPRVLLLWSASSAIEMTVPANDRSVPGVASSRWNANLNCSQMTHAKAHTAHQHNGIIRARSLRMRVEPADTSVRFTAPFRR